MTRVFCVSDQDLSKSVCIDIAQFLSRTAQYNPEAAFIAYSLGRLGLQLSTHANIYVLRSNGEPTSFSLVRALEGLHDNDTVVIADSEPGWDDFILCLY
jgi:hypothetical protein